MTSAVRARKTRRRTGRPRPGRAMGLDGSLRRGWAIGLLSFGGNSLPSFPDGGPGRKRKIAKRFKKMLTFVESLSRMASPTRSLKEEFAAFLDFFARPMSVRAFIEGVCDVEEVVALPPRALPGFPGYRAAERGRSSRSADLRQSAGLPPGPRM